MRRAPLLAVACLASLACASRDSPSAPAGPKDEARSALARNTAPVVSPADQQALVAGNVDFAAAVYGQLTAGSSANVAFSPHSISLALAMAYAGARGDTKSEMAAALHFTLPNSALHAAFDWLDLTLASRATTPVPHGALPVTLHVACSMWGDRTESFEQPFLDTLATSYGAGVRLVDFRGDPDGSRAAIDGWVATETDQAIPELLPPGSVGTNTRIVLADAVAFEGTWKEPFEEGATTSAPFTRADGSTVSAAMMTNGIDTSPPIAQSDAYDAVELFYSGHQLAMDVVMPKPGTLASFEWSLGAASLAAIFSALHGVGPVDLRMPKFALGGASRSLVPILRALGMKAAFDPDLADFSGAAHDPDGPLYVKDVLHAASVEIDEKGTKASAATGVILDVDGGVLPEPPPSIVVDHPFLFFVRDVPTGAILFMGRVTDPTAP